MPFDVPPSVLGTLAIAVIAVAVTPIWWAATGYVTTLVDLATRESVALLTGVSVKGTFVRATGRKGTFRALVIEKRGWWPNKVLVGLVGPPAPSITGLLVAFGAVAGWTPRVVYIVLIVLVTVMFLRNNNWFALLLSAAVIGALALFAFFATPPAQVGGLAFIAWLLLLGGLRHTAEMAAEWEADGGPPRELSRLTDVPAAVWAFGFVVVSLGSLVAGARWLLGA